MSRSIFIPAAINQSKSVKYMQCKLLYQLIAALGQFLEIFRQLLDSFVEWGTVESDEQIIKVAFPIDHIP